MDKINNIVLVHGGFVSGLFFQSLSTRTVTALG
jgi:hypothetical protein